MTSKYEREIREILEKMDEFVPPPSLQQRVGNRVRGRWWRWRNQPRRGWSFAPGQLMLTALALIVASFVLRFFPFGGLLATVVGLAGVILFVVAFILSLTARGRYGNREQRWRGRPIDVPRDNPLADWFRRLFRRR